MRKASMILGIIGGVIASMIALIAITGGAVFSTSMSTLMETSDDVFTSGEYAEFDNVQFDDGIELAGKVFLGIGSAILIAGILGIVGGAMVKRKNVLAGVLMLVGSVITLFTVWAFISFILLLLGGIFALVKDTNVQQSETSRTYENIVDV